MNKLDLNTVEDLYNMCGVDINTNTQLRTEINTGKLYAKQGNTYTCNNHTQNCSIKKNNSNPSKKV